VLKRACSQSGCKKQRHLLSVPPYEQFKVLSWR
jgi:hypothetical protein